MNYVTDSNQQNMYKYMVQYKKKAQDDLEYFRNLNQTIDTKIYNNVINIFINMSQQSNGYLNFMNDNKKYINKFLNIYYHKKSGIELHLKIFIENSDVFKKLENIILNSDFDYYTPLRADIELYIKDNSIKNCFIYY
jgi:hypothetical protein